MSLRDRISQAKQTPGPTCAVGILLTTLTDTQRAELVELCDSDEKSSILAKAVNAEYGTTIAGNTMSRHRRRDCKCP